MTSILIIAGLILFSLIFGSSKGKQTDQNQKKNKSSKKQKPKKTANKTKQSAKKNEYSGTQKVLKENINDGTAAVNLSIKTHRSAKPKRTALQQAFVYREILGPPTSTKPYKPGRHRT
ncbi:hypothetical protein [Risungbinella massiliensis]|uniref:hypothetical protein n=1 Tax=Risungbinella massiliensis TaxID=1329796 RepID=UPI0005CBDBF5|nr:hypothetical protein [Risungbinella massiliensis]